VSTRWTFTPAIVASVHCPCAALRHPGFACFRSPLAGTGTPSLIKCGATQEIGSGSDQTGSTADAASAATAASRRPPAASSECTARPTGGRMPPMNCSRTSQTLALWRSAQRKVGHDARAFRKAASQPTATRRQDAAHQHQRKRANLGFVRFRPRKSRHDVGVFLETSKPPASGPGRLGRRRGRRRQVTLESAAAGCISPPGRCGKPSQS